MPRVRLYPPSDWPESFQHCYSRLVHGHRYFDDEEKDELMKCLCEYAFFCDITLVTKTVMGNHYHVEAQLPRRPEVMPSDEEFFKRLEGLTTKQARKDKRNLETFIKEGKEAQAQALRQRLFALMYDRGIYIKLALERFSQWFNRKNKRKGTLWQAPYGCVM